MNLYVSLFFVLFLLLTIAKLAGGISVGWIVVTMPLWVPPTCLVSVFILFGLLLTLRCVSDFGLRGLLWIFRRIKL